MTSTLNAYAMLVEPFRASPTFADSSHSQIIYPVLGLTGKAGEVASIIKKGIRDGNSLAKNQEQLKIELGNLLFYINAVTIAAGMTLDEIADANIKRLQEKNHHA